MQDTMQAQRESGNEQDSPCPPDLPAWRERESKSMSRGDSKAEFVTSFPPLLLPKLFPSVDEHDCCPFGGC